MNNKFTTRMQVTYEDNVHKKDPKLCTQNELLNKLKNKHYDLTSAVCRNEHDKVKKLTVDIANYAKFLFDNADNVLGDR